MGSVMGHKPLITPQPSHFRSDQGSGRAPAGLMGGAGPIRVVQLVRLSIRQRRGLLDGVLSRERARVQPA